LFFVLSGFVLSKVFAPYIHVPVATLSGRAIRLFVPGLCACAYGFLMFLLTRHYAPHAYGAQFAHWAVFMKDALISVPLLGYQGLSIFDHVPLLGPYVAPPDSAANEPLWSLSVEWQGSILIFGLMTLRNIDRRLWVTAMVFWV
jgi:peptidoglycan/LPS O-acetylase OafA/YrhL